MWTFLGIASFTYIYKKCDALVSYAPRELMVAAVLCVSVGLIFTCLGLRGQTLKAPQFLQIPFKLLSTFSLTRKLFSTSSTDSCSRTSKKVRYCVFDHYYTLCLFSLLSISTNKEIVSKNLIEFCDNNLNSLFVQG